MGFVDGLNVGYKREARIKDDARLSDLGYWKIRVVIN